VSPHLHLLSLHATNTTHTNESTPKAASFMRNIDIT
jgi:hypothetical protein